jgi:hypothetical protein
LGFTSRGGHASSAPTPPTRSGMNPSTQPGHGLLDVAARAVTPGALAGAGRCRPARLFRRSPPGLRWPSRLVATAEEKRLRLSVKRVFCGCAHGYRHGLLRYRPMHLLLHADNSAWQLAVQLTRPIDSGHLRMHASYPESHLLVHCSRDSCANRSLGVSVPASLDVTPDSHTRKTTAHLNTCGDISISPWPNPPPLPSSLPDVLGSCSLTQ